MIRALICPIICTFALIYAQVAYEYEPVVITATRCPRNILEITRTVTIIDTSEIRKYSSLAQILETAAGLDMKVRGGGIQADLSVRGSTFQQVLVMVDGIRVNDPQTGHHNLNVPIPLSKIEQIEILRGPASSLYGSDACGGVINIITKKCAGITGSLDLGGFGYKKGAARLAGENMSVDAEAKRSDGYEPGYEYTACSASSEMHFNPFRNSMLSLQAGYLNKEFGAKNFYAPYPSWEKNQALFVNLNNRWFIGPCLTLDPMLIFRTHIDTFILDVSDPLFYANRHQTYTYGAQVAASADLKNAGNFVAGAEIFRDSLNSSRLGQRCLQRCAAFTQAEKKFLNNKTIVVVGIRDDYYSGIGNSVTPHFSVGCLPLPFLKLNCSIGNSFRVASFTELYYLDPVNSGDSLLKPEKSREYEFGIGLFANDVTFQSSFFMRNASDNIDWVKRAEETVWQARNIGMVRYYGFESEIRTGFLTWLQMKTGLTCMHTVKELPRDYASKYALEVPSVAAYTGIRFFCFFDVDQVFYCYDSDDTDQDKDMRFLINASFHSNVFVRQSANIIYTFSIDNIMDKKYEDFRDVPLPGRVWRTGLSLSI